MTRRTLLSLTAAVAAQPARRPNVILIISDDQGYGDLSLHGNQHLRTPNLDRIGTEGAQFTQFQVCPVCSPTRSSLMTGRYNYRTGVVDTFLGRSLMDPRETTAAEVFAANGYRTGIFGKWHLGDNYPMRAHDQGFQESLVHGGGGLSQPADPPPGNHYFDPVLLRNGKFEKTPGYCTDIFFNEAMRFVEQNKSRPFFVYLPTNAPHTPLEVDGSYVAPFRAKGLDETTEKVYGMVKNLDDNAGRLLAHLDKHGLAANTIVIFMTDNGPQQPRYVAGMRGRKGTVYQGGIRVPFFLRWPERVRPGAKVGRIAAHIDVLPTLIEACGLKPPKGVKFDGMSIWPLLQGEPASWPDRALHTQWHRGDQPELFRAHAARSQKWKLVHGIELYDMENDPAEATDVAAKNPDVVAKLRAETERWFADVASTRGGYAPPRIFIGTPHENPVLLTRQDWRETTRCWEVDVRTKGVYDATLLFPAAAEGGAVTLKFAGVEVSAPVPKGAARHEFKGLKLKQGPSRVEAELRVGNQPGVVQYIEVRKINA
ncbi:MAG: arylsulfatase [Acidobacteria bacterium]|nr:arylsulfatase [Acidobacteriota bacterium]